MPKIKPKIEKESWRAKSAWGAVTVVFLLFIVQTVNVQLSPDKRILSQSQKQYWAHVPITTSRGDIRDRNDVPLAISVPSTSFFIDPLFWAPSSSDVLIKYFGQSIGNKYARELPGRFHWVTRKVPNDIAQGLSDMRVPGLFSVRESQRLYPHGELASHVIGFCDIDDVGLSGVELAWNNILFSPPQSRLFVRDARGKMLDLIGSNAGTLQVGAGSIHLTLDSRFQQIVEWKLKEGAENAHAQWGVGICVNPKTGEVLAMASYPWIDLNNRSSFNNMNAIRNNAIGRVYEPGSTFKPIALGIAKDMGMVHTGDHFFCRGKIAIADGIVRDVSAHGQETLEDLLIKSCNTGMATVGNRFNTHKAYGMLRLFGFGQKSDIEIAGEEEGLLRTPEQWLGLAPANVAIGQGLAVTPIQLVMGIASIANGGELLKPYIISDVKNASGKIIYQGKKRVRSAVLSRETCVWIRNTLRQTVVRGTGKAAATEAAEVAGKTGTAQIASRGEYAKGQYVSSFVGFWPYDDPNYVLLVILGEPSGARYYGGEIAAPVFKSIVEDIAQITTDPTKGLKASK